MTSNMQVCGIWLQFYCKSFDFFNFFHYKLKWKDIWRNLFMIKLDWIHELLNYNGCSKFFLKQSLNKWKRTFKAAGFQTKPFQSYQEKILFQEFYSPLSYNFQFIFIKFLIHVSWITRKRAAASVKPRLWKEIYSSSFMLSGDSWMIDCM